MMTLKTEITANFESFSAGWQQKLEVVREELSKRKGEFAASYEQLASIGAWAGLLEGEMSKESFAFFREAQNDALVSHVMARCGSWRVAHKALRSMMENVVLCVFYKDHPVELSMWNDGRHRLGFRDALDYLSNHPLLHGMKEVDTGIADLRKQYGVASRAVHASATSFRMTTVDDSTNLWTADKARLGQWRTAESDTLAAINTVLIGLFRARLSGTSRRGERKVIALAIPKSRHSRIKSLFSVSLYSS
jgi:hypothetical protein